MAIYLVKKRLEGEVTLEVRAIIVRKNNNMNLAVLKGIEACPIGWGLKASLVKIVIWGMNGMTRNKWF